MFELFIISLFTVVDLLGIVCFLGELKQDCQLPAKKSFGTCKHEFIDNKREQFEQYLQVSYGLVHVPSEKSSGTSKFEFKSTI